MTALRNLSEAESQRIHQAIAAVEARTHGHVALAVVRVSDRYLLFPLLWAALAALAVGGLLALVWPALPLRESFAIQAAVFVILSLAFDWLPLRLALVPRRFKHAQARILAHREFASRILADRGQRVGVVFFVSLGERYVEVVAERRLHERVDEAAWEAIVAEFATAVKIGRIADGFVAAITACGDLLAQHFPKG